MENEALTPAFLGDDGTNDTSAITEPIDGNGAPPLETARETEAAPTATDPSTHTEDTDKEPEGEDEAPRFEKLLRSDLAVLARRFPERFSSGAVDDLPNAVRYGELREAGLSPVEAFCASHYESLLETQRAPSNRAHLESCIPRTARPAADRMSTADLEMARSLFPSLPDSEIEGLYRRVGHGKRH